MSQANESGAGTVSRVIDILRYIAQHENASIRAISGDLGLAPSTSHQLLHLLAREGMIEHDAEDRRYGAGSKLSRLAILTVSRYRLRELALPFLNEIVEATGETALLCLHHPARRCMIFAEKVESRHLLRYDLPLYQDSSLLWGASGRSITAFLEEDEIRLLHETGEVSPSTGQPLPPLPTFLEEMGRIRRQGYAVSRGKKIAGALGINAPFFNHGRIVGNIGITMPDARATDDSTVQDIELIRGAAQRLTDALNMREINVPK